LDQESARRRLVAILAADIVGYSRLMGEDETATLATLRAYRAACAALIDSHRGRIVGTAGDSMLAEFASVVRAVECAVGMQREIAERNAGLPEDRRMLFRIGVNLGDVLVEQDDLYGDGVNIAARLQALADPGGILISGLGFVNNEFIMPVYTSRATYIRKVEIEKSQQRVMFQQSKLWLRGPENSIVNIELVSPNRNEMLGLNIYKLNPDYSVREWIKAGSLVWGNGSWKLKNSLTFTQENDVVKSRPSDNEVFNIVESPDNLGMIEERPSDGDDESPGFAGARTARFHLRILSYSSGNRVGQLFREPVHDVIHSCSS